MLCVCVCGDAECSILYSLFVFVMMGDHIVLPCSSIILVIAVYVFSNVSVDLPQ